MLTRVPATAANTNAPPLSLSYSSAIAPYRSLSVPPPPLSPLSLLKRNVLIYGGAKNYLGHDKRYADGVCVMSV